MISMGTTKTKSDGTGALRGRLIAVEGLDGSGKSTQIHLLYRWLQIEGYKVFITEWNSSVLVKQAKRRGKKEQLLTPTTFSLIHSTDFADRYERQILPLLKAGFIVLCDRYYYTAFARDIVRGCDPGWLTNIYSFAVKPHIIFFFQTPLEVALSRILSNRPRLKFHEAGMDMGLSNDIVESFKLFQNRVNEEYLKMAPDKGFTIIDATRPIKDQQDEVREILKEKIDLPAYFWRNPK